MKIKIGKYVIILLGKMTFKEFISALFEKWACKHDWERWQIIHVTDDMGGSYHIYHFKCNKCGKFKKVKSY